MIWSGSSSVGEPVDVEHCSQVIEMVAFTATLGCNIVNITFHRYSQMITENYAHGALISCTRILQSERHYCVKYTPNGILNDVCFSSSECILIWLYPEKPSMKDILSKPHVLSIMTPVMGNKNSYLGQAALRSQKSMQTLIFPFFFSTGTILATQSGCCSSWMKLHSWVYELRFRLPLWCWVKIIIVVT